MGDNKTFTHIRETQNTNKRYPRGETPGEKVGGSRRKQPRSMNKVLKKRPRRKLNKEYKGHG